MRRLLVLASTISAPLLAHPGHGATPAHVHPGGFPVDVGAIVVVSAVVVGLAVFALRKRSKND